MRKELIDKMYDIIAASTAESNNLADIIEQLIDIEEDGEKVSSLIILMTEVKMYEKKLSKMSKSILDKKFDVVEMAKRGIKDD